MKRLAGIVGAMLILFLIAVPVAIAADPLPQTGRLIISTEGDVTVAAEEQADLVIVTGGTATIEGTVNALLVVDGVADLTGATVDSIVAVRSPVTVGPGSVVLGDVRTVDSLVLKMGDGEVQGDVRDLATDLIAVGAVLAPAAILFFIGFALATVIAGLTLAGLASRQLRAAETLISRDIGRTLLAGLGGLILLPLVAIVAIASIVGAPLGIGLLIFVWPLLAFLGYIVAAVWIGDWVLRQVSPTVVRERPYAAVVVGIVAMQVLSIIPPLAAIASFVGFGAVILYAWRTFQGRSQAAPAPSFAGSPAAV
jgi:hypothetical protein